MSTKHDSHSTTHTFAHHIPKLCKELPPLKEDKSPLVAAMLGFAFGPFGIALYFKSGIDFAICFAILVVLSLTGVLAPIGWLFAGAYGAHRANESNRKRRQNTDSSPAAKH